NVELKYFDVLAQVFYILGTAEISNNTTRYDGVKFGYRAENVDGINDLYIRSRTEGFGRDMQLASIVGCMVLSQEHYDDLYHKAMQIRRLTRDYYAGQLAEIDALALPVKLDSGGKYEQSALYALSALGGFPSLALPYKDTPVQFIGKRGGEDALFTLAKEGLSCNMK
ncbi:MAG: amidase family protein, partial [Firmicutes bacterium]|nr:amidase family protein [Bacillota bacterium]